jgi:5-methylcytosine-specific restriction protein B
MTDAYPTPFTSDFLRWVAPLLDALRILGGEGKTAEVIEQLRLDPRFSDEDRNAVTAGGHSRFVSKTSWARFYLAKGGYVSTPKYGLWRLTEKGRAFDATPSAVVALFDMVREAQGWTTPEQEDDTPVDEVSAEPPVYRSDVPPPPEDAAFWFAGAGWSTGDQFERFYSEGIWENGYDDQFADLVREMRPGEKIAIKAAFVQKRGLPFDNSGKSVSAMSIKATGTILENPGDGKRVRVAWDPMTAPRKWFFYTYRTTLVRADTTNAMARALIGFTFSAKPQDYDFFLAEPYWQQKYGKDAKLVTLPTETVADVEEETVEDAPPPEPPYTVADIVAEGCFVPDAELAEMLGILAAKKNLVLQGPPGTGKTWLAKRLAAALIRRAPKSARERMRLVQFHPSLSYEDFVRGWRPTGDGKLALTDGVFLEAVKAAEAESDVPFVVVIEEINRGNPAQIFGELLTLLEHDKRSEDEALALAYPRAALERVFLPPNLYLIGTMNIADRSLALVDLALRRRFAFVTLTPRFDAAWRAQLVAQNGLDADLVADIGQRMTLLNDGIAAKLGGQFRIGHSYLTPRRGPIADGRHWFRTVAATEIGPLLAEYFYDDPAEADRLLGALTEGLA